MKIAFLGDFHTNPLAFQAANLGAEIVAPDQADVIVCSGAGTGPEAERLRKAGYRVLFGGKFAELMDRRGEYAEGVAKKAGWAWKHTTLPDKLAPPHELIVGCWYENAGLHPPYFSGVLRTRMESGDKGAEGGLVAAELRPGVAGELLNNLPDVLATVGYTGLVSIILLPGGEPAGIMVGIHPVIIEALCEQLRGGLLALLHPAHTEGTGDVSAALLCTVPPWPYGAPTSLPEIRLDDGQKKRVWLEDPSTGVVGVVSARGRTFEEAGGRAAWTARNLGIPGLQYRKDIGKNTKELLSCLLTPTELSPEMPA